MPVCPPTTRGDVMIKLSWNERAVYVLGVILCIIGDALHDAWIWLQCPPAPAATYQEEDPLDPFTKTVKVISYGVAIMSAIALTILVLAYPI